MTLSAPADAAKADLSSVNRLTEAAATASAYTESCGRPLKALWKARLRALYSNWLVPDSLLLQMTEFEDEFARSTMTPSPCDEKMAAQWSDWAERDYDKVQALSLK